MKSVWLVASENGAFPGGKVGGVGDVVNDLPLALAAKGVRVRVITPSYGKFHRLHGSMLFRKITVKFARRRYVATVYQVPVTNSPVAQFVIEHPLLSPNGPGQIYVSDEPDRPFATDAAKFAFFNAAVAAWVNSSQSPPDVLHLNDWHTGLIPALREFGDDDAPLKSVRVVFTIHNLAYQGIRPFEGDKSSLQAWFPDLLLHASVLRDPRYDNCVNFMVTAIRLADGINTVSESYAQEIQRPSDPSTGFSGGEGLEGELATAYQQGRLVGILNGCMYPEKTEQPLAWTGLLQQIALRREIMNTNRPPAEWIAEKEKKQPRNLLLSIGRVADQKVPLFLEPVKGHATALQAILDDCGPDTLFIMLGSGEKELEERFVEIARTSSNFLYLRGYVEDLPALLYASTNLFLMPSSFEPCGISQMLSMRAGQPCVVHAVGGLKDTVEDLVTGFVFDGASPEDQAENFVASVRTAISIKQDEPKRWQAICANARRQRFSWGLSADTYIERLYHFE